MTFKFQIRERGKKSGCQILKNANQRDWINHEFEMPIELNGKTTLFRWRQSTFDNPCDNRGLDYILIETFLYSIPAAPDYIIVGDLDSQSTVVFWLPVTNADFYIVERSITALVNQNGRKLMS